MKFLYGFNDYLIEASTFDDLDTLGMLDLGNNQIVSIDANALKLPQCIELRLYGKELSSIENASNHTFKGVKYLMLFIEMPLIKTLSMFSIGLSK